MTADHSGSSTSKAAAARRATRIPEVHTYVYLTGERGATWRDVADYLEVHHGVASGALSALHRRGDIVRLTETRERCHVYVNPQFVGERDTQPYGGRAIQRDYALRQVEKIRMVVLTWAISSSGTAAAEAMAAIEKIVADEP